MSSTDTPRRMFRSVLHEALPDDDQRRRAERSLHEEKLLSVFQTGTAELPNNKYLPYFKHDSMSKHPAISVVDIDRDGFDDLYLMARWGRNQLIREYRCGEGFAAQNSSTLLIGIGDHPSASRVTVRWPSGKTSQVDIWRPGPC